MSRIAIDIVLLPDASMTAGAIEANADLVERCASGIILDAETCLPHITIGYGTVEQEMRFPMRFTARRLAICHLGNHCTCRKILASVRL